MTVTPELAVPLTEEDKKRLQEQLKIEKFNPHHGERGRFSSSDYASGLISEVSANERRFRESIRGPGFQKENLDFIKSRASRFFEIPGSKIEVLGRSKDSLQSAFESGKKQNWSHLYETSYQ
jgi:hypothetical protein